MCNNCNATKTLMSCRYRFLVNKCLSKSFPVLLNFAKYNWHSSMLLSCFSSYNTTLIIACGWHGYSRSLVNYWMIPMVKYPCQIIFFKHLLNILWGMGFQVLWLFGWCIVRIIRSRNVCLSDLRKIISLIALLGQCLYWWQRYWICLAMATSRPFN